MTATTRVPSLPRQSNRKHASLPSDKLKRPGMGDEKRTTLSLPLTMSDKKTLKTMAAQRDTTIAAIIHERVQKHLEKVSE